MSKRSGFSTGWMAMPRPSSVAYALIGMCMAVGAVPARGQCADEQKLNASDAMADDEFGFSVSVDGDYAIVGAYLDDLATEVDAGSAYVFVRCGGAWIEQQHLTAGLDADAGDLFGYSVSISGDTVVVGAPLDDDVNADVGAAYVFVRTGTVWTQQPPTLTAPAPVAGDQFGFAVSVSGDTAVVGEIFDDHMFADAGSAYVFVRSAGVWALQQHLTAGIDAGLNDQFGNSVSVNGETVIVGARANDDAGNNSGSAYVFVRSLGVWTEQEKLTASDASVFDSFGDSVSVSGDTIVVGAQGVADAGVNTGSAYVYERSGVDWTQQLPKLSASDANGDDHFGQTVSVSGNTAVIGAQGNDDAGSGSGSAYVFVRSGGSWTEQEKLTAGDAAANDRFGYSVSVSGDTALIGAILNDGDGGSDSGSAYVRSVNCPGACCVDGGCELVKQATCAVFAGAFFGQETACDTVTCPSLCGADIIPCPTGDGTVDIFDILGVLDAFSGADCCAP
ncbi:MAG: hypothetical protein HOP29_14135 [Phycisphaerales bacterium]|nr:hypothetical protein [Phycisphaerales bacterium]